MTRTCDYIQSFESWWGTPAKCRMRIYTVDETPTIILCTALPENQESIDTMMEEISTQSWQLANKPLPFIWIEQSSARTELSQGETFYKVIFTQPPNRFQMPQGKFINKNEVEALLGETLD